MCTKKYFLFLYSLLFFQAGVNRSFNKIFVRGSPLIWIEAYTKHEKEKEPLLYILEGGIAYPGYEIKSGLKVVEPNTQEYSGHAYFNSGEKQSRIEFTAERANSADVHYIFTASALIPEWEPMKVNGKLALADIKRNAEMVWKYGVNNYSAVIEYIKGTEQLLTGTVQINNIEYVGKVIIRDNKEDQSISVDLVGSRHIQFISVITKSHYNILLDFFWDKSNDTGKRISIKASARECSILAEFVAMNLEGRFSASYSPSSLDVSASWDIHHIGVELKMEIFKRNFEFLIALQTSFHGLTEVRVHNKLRYERSLLGVEVDSRVSNKKGDLS